MDIPKFHETPAFNAHHSPMGAFFSFTCGHFSTRGGLGLQLGKPANQDLFIGIKNGPRNSTAEIRCLPFFEGAQQRDNAQSNFTPESAPAPTATPITCYNATEISRHYAWSTDTWKTPDFHFTIYTPFAEIPDPATATPDQLKSALLPAITAELTIDNTHGTQIKTAFFAINFNEPGARLLDQHLEKNRAGFALRAHLGIAAEVVPVPSPAFPCTADEVVPVPSPAFPGDATTKPTPFMRWALADGLAEPTPHLLGHTPGLAIEVPPGKSLTLRLAIGCYLAGTVTTRLEGRYLYTKYYKNLEEVLNTALNQFPQTKILCEKLDQKLLTQNLNRDQQFLIAHSTRSYYGCTQILEINGEPYWIVNEGEYCMMNTLDLSVDHMFWELKQNPWVVKNLLNNFIKHYSYHDQVKIPIAPGLPGETHPNTTNTQSTSALHPGGISFAHDQGVHNQFSPQGTSSYELPNLHGCFSFMTQEQLCNWILIAASYVAHSGDLKWLKENEHVVQECFGSMLARTRQHQLKERTTAGLEFGEGSGQFYGIMCYDSALCATGSEITTYDSLDSSLGQARNNLYIAVKCWASYIGLSILFAHLEKLGGYYSRTGIDFPLAISEVLAYQLNAEKFLPAIFGDPLNARILPAIEPLIYPMFWKTAPHIHATAVPGMQSFMLTPNSQILHMLRTHTITLLSDTQDRNKFPDGGIRLSSTSDNSWASKIAIIQHVARRLFNLDENGNERPIPTQDSGLSTQHSASGWEKSDTAHTRWQTNPTSAYWACSDQIINGTAKGSKYYPRIITTTLWLDP